MLSGIWGPFKNWVITCLFFFLNCCLTKNCLFYCCGNGSRSPLQRLFLLQSLSQCSQYKPVIPPGFLLCTLCSVCLFVSGFPGFMLFRIFMFCALNMVKCFLPRIWQLVVPLPWEKLFSLFLEFWVIVFGNKPPKLQFEPQRHSGNGRKMRQPQVSNRKLPVRRWMNKHGNNLGTWKPRPPPGRTGAFSPTRRHSYYLRGYPRLPRADKKKYRFLQLLSPISYPFWSYP